MKDIVVPTWAKALGIVAIALGIIYAISAYNGWLINVGKTAERAEWLKRENAELVAAKARIKTLEDEARAQEHAHGQAMVAASTQYQKDLSHEQATKDGVIADLRAGTRRLRIELAAAKATGGSGAAQAGAGPGRCDGPATAELSQSAAEFLVDLASEADTVVHQLTACQAVVVADRKINATEGDPEK